MTKRVGIYLRVSTAGQTVENQRIDLQAAAAQRGWQIVGEYVDHGISGAKGRDKRPGFQRLCKDATAGKFDLIAAWSVDRLGRSVLHLAQFVEDMRASEVGLLLLKQGIDSETPTGRAMLAMCAVFAELEREIMRERINAGVARAKAQGKHCGRPAASDAGIAREVREMRAKKVSLSTIARTLNVGRARVERVLEVGGERVA
jgi:DNA invertase Pin-like site-specific DNA recombinase